MNEIRFNPETHEYWIDDIPAISVTTLLKEMEIINTEEYANISVQTLNNAATRGKYGHKMIELYLKGTLDESTVDEQLVPYLVGFKKFLDNHTLETLGTEEIVYNKNLLAAGTMDWRGKLDESPTIIDFKFVRALKKHYALQVGGYLYLYNSNVQEPEERVEKGLIVQILPNNYRLVKVDQDAQNEFMHLLIAWHIRRKYG